MSRRLQLVGPVMGLALAACVLPAGLPSRAAAQTPAAPNAPAPAAAPNAAAALPYFPLTAGTTWKYRVIVKNDDVADRPYVQTLTAGTPIQSQGRTLYPVGDQLYVIADDAAWLFGQRDGAKIVALDAPRKCIGVRPHTSDSWHFTSAGQSTYVTCLGNQTIKTDAGEYDTTCIFSSASGADGTAQTQVYRYFARGVGLVRETRTENTRKADNTPSTRSTTRDLIAFETPDNNSGQAPSAQALPIGVDAFHGQLLDPSGQPMAQVTLTLDRIDKPGAESLQTDASGTFSKDQLDPAGVYVLRAQVPGYEADDVPLHAVGHGPLNIEVRLKTEMIPIGNASQSPGAIGNLFKEGRRLAEARNHQAAIAKYNAALAIDPNQPNILAYKALSNLALGQTHEADLAITEAMRRNDKEYTFLEIAGQTKLAENQIDAGRALYEKAAALSPRDAATIYTDLAAALAARKDDHLNGAIDAALKAAADANPPGAEALFQLGQSYASAGRIEGKAYLQRYLDVVGKRPASQQDPTKMRIARQLIKAIEAIQ